MKKSNVIMMLVASASLGCMSNAMAFHQMAKSSDDCQSKETKKYAAHCVNFESSLKQNDCRFVRQDSAFMGINIGVGMCEGNNFDNYIMKEGLDGVSPGKYSDTYTQCSDMNCTSTVSVGVDNYVLNSNKTINPYEFIAQINAFYGQPYNSMNLYDLSTSLSQDITVNASCNSGLPRSSKLQYCATLTNQPVVNKFVKIADDTEFTVFCANSDMRFGYTLDGLDKGDKVKAGTNHLSVSQCDNFECKNPKLIGQDTIVLSTKGTVDHSTKAYTLDPAYGEDCSR